MKNFFMIFIAALLLTSCAKQSSPDEPGDKWNGYSKYLKMGEVTHNLYAGKNNIIVGTVTYGIDDNANFYVTYDCNSTDWKLVETHMFAGDKKNMPLNKAGNPKINRFPHNRNHNPKVKTYTYTVPLTSLPPAEEPGFSVAAQCVVYNPLKCEGVSKVAWAAGDFKFTDKGKGWYDVFYYNQPDNEYTILYGMSYGNDSLRIYHIDVTNGTTELTFSEYVGNTAGSYDGAAYDPESGMLFFTKVNTNELWVNLLIDEDSSYVAGTLTGEATSATFYNDMFYYVDTNTNLIYGVTFNPDWTIAGETVLSTIPSSVAINDITMSPTGTNLYMVGEVSGGGTELITWQINTNTYYSTALAITYGGAQIAYGSDEILYVIAPSSDGGSSSTVFTLNPSTGTLTVIEEDLIPLPGSSFSDITTGPIM